MPITATVAAFQRIDQTIDTLRRIAACDPPPDEIIVHVDGGETATARAVQAAFPLFTVLQSPERIGPGGARNKMIAAARGEWVSTFDDDSYPLDNEFFARASNVIALCPDAALIACAITHRGTAPAMDTPGWQPARSFISCGALHHRATFLNQGGFVPLPIAYGMEEEDLVLRLRDDGKVLLFSSWLRVFHDTDLSHHASKSVTSGMIANLALLAWLRYPKRYWPYGAAQVLNRALWCARNGRLSGIVSGFASIPSHLWRHRQCRRPVAPQTISR